MITRKTAMLIVAVWIVLAGIALAVFGLYGRANAATVVTPIDSCLSGWFWNAGTGENETPPSLTPDGLYFNDDDTVNSVVAWHFTEAPLGVLADISAADKWAMVDFSTGSSGANTAFHVKTSPATGTWSYLGVDQWWTTGSADVPSTTYTGEQMAETLGNLDASIEAFGIGTDAVGVDQPGFTISKIFFSGEAFSLVCVPKTVISTVPGPVVIKTITVTASPEVSDPDTLSPSVTGTQTAHTEGPPPRTVPHVAPVSDNSDSIPWVGIAAGTMALVAAGGAALGAVAVRRRRQQADLEGSEEYQAANQELDTALANLYPGHYEPNEHPVDNSPTQVIPYVDNGDAETEQLPKQD